MAAERRAQDVGDQDQHFVAVQVAETVVDLLEMVDVHHRQPLLQRLARVGVVALREHFVGRDSHAARNPRTPRELLIEGLAVEQPRECIALAVVQQALVILIDVEDALDHVQLVHRKRPRLRHLDAGVHLVVHPHRHPQRVLALAQRMQRAPLFLHDAFVQCGVLRQWLAA